MANPIPPLYANTYMYDCASNNEPHFNTMAKTIATTIHLYSVLLGYCCSYKTIVHTEWQLELGGHS